jgi:hypothetical protein
MCAKSVQQLEMTEYFHLRPGSRNWQVRLIAPQSLQPFLDKPDYRKSTGTSDRKRARVIGTQLILDKLQEWEVLQASVNVSDVPAPPTHLSTSLIAEICERRLASWLKSDEDERYENGGLTTDEFDELERFCELTDAAMRATLARGPASTHWNHALDAVFDWCLTLGYDVSPEDPQLNQLVRSFAAADKLAMTKLSARNAGEEVETPKEPSQRAISHDATPKSSHRMSAMTPLYEPRKSKTVEWKSVSKNVSIWNRFVAFMSDAPLDSIRSSHVYHFLEERLNAAEDYWSMEYAHGPACTALDEVFSLARTMEMMTAPNPVKAMESKPTISKDENAKRKHPRRPFTTAQINAIFQSDWYDPNAANWKGKMGQDLAARYWPPLVDQLHGLRGVEALQLIADDFNFSGPVPLVTFKVALADDDKQDEAPIEGTASKSDNSSALPARRQKNDHTRRTLPIHPKLVELGLVQYVNGRKALGSNTPLFDSSLPEPGGEHPQWGRAYSQRFLPFVRDTLGFGRGYGNHSWRHKFEDAIREANVRNGTWPAGVPQLLSGRRLPRVIDREIFREVSSAEAYGDGYDPASLLKYLAQLNFEEIKFPPPYERWIAGAVDTQRRSGKRRPTRPR